MNNFNSINDNSMSNNNNNTGERTICEFVVQFIHVQQETSFDQIMQRDSQKKVTLACI